MDSKAKKFVETLLDWYDVNGEKDLPWRSTKDPWKIFLAAFLLRKTTRKQVLKIFDKIVRLFPSPSDILKYDQKFIENLLKPLGLYRHRSKSLMEIARVLSIRFGGKFPSRPEELLRLKLKGVGPYIINEVLCGAFGIPVPMLDTNMIRVLVRVFGLVPLRKRPKDDPNLWNFARRIVELSDDCRKINYAIFDFATKICKPKNPECGKCPIKDICEYASKRLRSNRFTK